MQLINTNVSAILQASPPAKTQAVSAQTSLELLSAESPSKRAQGSSGIGSTKPTESVEDYESKDKQMVIEENNVQQTTIKAEEGNTKEEPSEEVEDGAIESMESLMNKAFKGQTLLGDQTKLEKAPQDDHGEAEDDDVDDVLTGSSSKSMMMTGLLNMALNSELLGGLEPVDEVDEEKSESAITSARDSDKAASIVEEETNVEIVTNNNPDKQEASEGRGGEDQLKKKEKAAEKEHAKIHQEETKIIQNKDNVGGGGEGKTEPSQLPRGLKNLEEDVHSLKNDFKAMVKDVNEIKIDVGDIKKDVKSMNKNLKTDLRVIKDKLREGTMASSIVETASDIDALIEGRAVGREITVRMTLFLQMITKYFSCRISVTALDRGRFKVDSGRQIPGEFFFKTVDQNLVRWIA